MRFTLSFRKQRKDPSNLPSWGTLRAISPTDANYPGWEDGAENWITPDVEDAPLEIWVDDMKFTRESLGSDLYPYRYVYDRDINGSSLLHPEVCTGIIEPGKICTGGTPCEEYTNATVISGTETFSNRWFLYFCSEDEVGYSAILNDPDEVMEQVGGYNKKWQNWARCYALPGLISEVCRYVMEQYDIMEEEDGVWYGGSGTNGEDGIAMHMCNGDRKHIATRLGN